MKSSKLIYLNSFYSLTPLLHFLLIIIFFSLAVGNFNAFKTLFEKFSSRQERGIIGLSPEIFGHYDEGNIRLDEENLLDRTESMLNIFFKNTYTDIQRVYYKRVHKENRINYTLMVTKYIAGMERDIQFSLESTGTQSLLQLLPFVLVVVKGSVAIIDGFDTALHDILVKSLISALNKDSEGQLILTTHNTLLWNQIFLKKVFMSLVKPKMETKKYNALHITIAKSIKTLILKISISMETTTVFLLEPLSTSILY